MRSTVGIPLLPAQAVAEGQGGGGCQDSVQRVGAGNALAQQTGETMQEMVGAIGKVNTIV